MKVLTKPFPGSKALVTLSNCYKINGVNITPDSRVDIGSFYHLDLVPVSRLEGIDKWIKETR